MTYAYIIEEREPCTYQEACESSEAPQWRASMEEEMEALHKNKTWDLVNLPKGRKAIGCRQVYKLKIDTNENVERYKSRLVVKGYAQKSGIDFNEIFSPVVHLMTIRTVLSMAVVLDLELEQLQNAKLVNTPLPIGCKLSSEQSPCTEVEKTKMSQVPYASAVGSFVFFMVCTKPNIAQAVGAISKYMGLDRRMKEVSKLIDEFLEKIIDEHINKSKGHEDNQKDFIDMMLSLMVESKNMNIAKEEQHYMIDRTNIKAIILDMILAARDTSAVTIEWALSKLLRHPKMMEKLQEELRNKVGIDRLVEKEDLVKLEYLDMVVKETIRLHHVAPLLAPHESLEDITINGYYIPKKSRLYINVWAIQRDQNMWSTYDDVENFLLERFMGTGIDTRGRSFQLIPFGSSGRRICLGIHLGLTFVKLVLGQLVHGFNWELPNAMSVDNLDMTKKFGLVASRANHLLVAPSYRLCLSGNNL
ncbi:cytochrome P450 71AU50-like [Macadamia integrifolia]|uniref:cytochrome P450 71AU50-like n=1 Tax=Macadamia integrifolia TaxID=60698 RepID=UPI001C4E382F|nr:cytochrome P450 71AU50-like [Macadamia integrifolia]